MLAKPWKYLRENIKSYLVDLYAVNKKYPIILKSNTEQLLLPQIWIFNFLLYVWILSCRIRQCLLAQRFSISRDCTFNNGRKKIADCQSWILRSCLNETAKVWIKKTRRIQIIAITKKSTILIKLGESDYRTRAISGRSRLVAAPPKKSC